MFQPYKNNLLNDKIVISVRIRSDVLEEIDRLATEIGISRCEFINQCILFALDNLTTENKSLSK